MYARLVVVQREREEVAGRMRGRAVRLRAAVRAAADRRRTLRFRFGTGH